MRSELCVLWVRRDLRIRDNPALAALVSRGNPFVPIFFIEPYMLGSKPEHVFGYPQRFFLSKALPEFKKNFPHFYVVVDYPTKVFRELSKIFDLKIFVNEDVHPDFYKQISKIQDSGIEVNIFRDQLTVASELKTGNGNIYSVFTPFKKAVWDEFLAHSEAPVPDSVKTTRVPYLEELAVECDFENLWSKFDKTRLIVCGSHQINIDEVLGFYPDLSGWYFSEREALDAASRFCSKRLSSYHLNRNSLDVEGTSKLSLALTWGLVSARTLKNMVLRAINQDTLEVDSKRFPGAATFVSELIWREFYKYLFFHYPWLLSTEFQESKRGLPWLTNEEAINRFISWIRGQTGYSIVDAAMMELAKTGFMHNRTRMIVASILTKNLGVDWRWGQEYFRAMLIDLDDASNNGGWQWSASVGADPKPIRIFNPYLQAEKFDPKFEYRRKWLGKMLHEYEECGGNKFRPLINHDIARKEALRRYRDVGTHFDA